MILRSDSCEYVFDLLSLFEIKMNARMRSSQTQRTTSCGRHTALRAQLFSRTYSCWRCVYVTFANQIWTHWFVLLMSIVHGNCAQTSISIRTSVIMAETLTHRFVTFLGFLSILHAAYSAAQRKYLN